MENMSLLCATVILGNMAGQPASALNMFAGLFLAFRVLYTVVYIFTESKKYSTVRSFIFGLAAGLCLWQIKLAGQVLAVKSGPWSNLSITCMIDQGASESCNRA